jgi:hypothetical protein
MASPFGDRETPALDLPYAGIFAVADDYLRRRVLLWNAGFFITINVLMGLARLLCLCGFIASA